MSKENIPTEHDILPEDAAIPDELEGVLDDSTDMDDDEFEEVEGDDEDEQESEENK